MVLAVKYEPQFQAGVRQCHPDVVFRCEGECAFEIRMFVDIEETPVLVVARATASFGFRDLELASCNGIFYTGHGIAVIVVDHNDHALTMQAMPVLDIYVFGIAFNENQYPFLMRAY